ncbi:hypothetical protein EVAR_103949_1 [Eumeta japonica]|uniref:Uncharacterized protein n=1 Tax=Eumeta variegata TaxID=151549 RepID=A0A4C1YCC5_EUMVA|nr:hypothetical protein EVAR_103949_1 [Eumeta japonica]
MCKGQPLTKEVKIVHTTPFAQAAAFDFGLEIMDHLPHTPHLASSGHFLFSDLNTYIRGYLHTNDEGLKAFVTEYFVKQDVPAEAGSSKPLPSTPPTLPER